MTTSDVSLARLLAPITPAVLRAEHWGRRALHVAGGPTKLAPWRHPEGWRAWTLHDLHAASLDADGVQQREAVTLDQLDERLAAGCTICGDASGDPRLRRVLADLCACLAATSGRPFAKLYVSPPGRGYVLHADRYHVLVVQLSGRKRWWFEERPAVLQAVAGAEVTPDGRAVLTHPHQGAPLRADDGAEVPPPRDETLRQVTLAPGDCLYLPPGAWHRTEAVSTSVALSLSPPRTPLVERVTATLARMLLRDPRWRADLQGDDPAATLEAHLGELRALLDGLDPRVLARAWAMEHEQRLATLVAGDSVEAPAVSEVAEVAQAPAPGDLLERTDDRPLRWLVAPGDDGPEPVVFFYGGGQEWSLPRAAQPLLVGLARAAAFDVAQALAWAPALDPADVRGVLAGLLRAGVLRRAARDPGGWRWRR
ncbi:MAG: cupin-like domain-containing protein, partial [Myxococcales bacterium]|nr:cupin-like domain-containing protein [Myxococcales bacterium]